MRLVFGVASAMGLGENLSGVLGGIFVPPGAEEYNEDYGDDDLIVPDIFWIRYLSAWSRARLQSHGNDCISEIISR